MELDLSKKFEPPYNILVMFRGQEPQEIRRHLSYPTFEDMWCYINHLFFYKSNQSMQLISKRRIQIHGTRNDKVD